MKRSAILLVGRAALLVLVVGGALPAAAATGVEAGLTVWNVGYETYQVCPGDTVENIAARYGVTTERICALNGLRDSGELAPGQSLVIVLPGRPRIYEDRREESPATPPDSPEPSLASSRINRYASVAKSCRVLSARPPARGTTYYQLDPGMRVITSGEKDGYLGIVMLDGSTGWIPATAAEVSDEVVASEALQRMLVRGQSGSGVVRDALSFLGTPYRLGGRLPRDVDCSLLVQTVFARQGVRLPRRAADQAEVGRPVTMSELQPADRLYFINRSGRISHTALYIGNSQFVHASSNRGCVAVDSLSDPHYLAMFYTARR